ncbi:hypothetical protein [Streptomyces sp. NPDC001020]
MAADIECVRPHPVVGDVPHCLVVCVEGTHTDEGRRALAVWML